MATPPFYIYDLLSSESQVRWQAGVALGSPVTIAYSFPTSQPAIPGNPAISGYTAFTATEQAAVQQALALISSFTKITFTQVAANSAAANIRFGNANLNTVGAPPGITYYSFGGAGLSVADVLLTTGTNSIVNGGFTPGSIVAADLGGQSWQTLLHEIGHALGLKHPFETNIAGDATSILATNLDNYVNSIMSYTPYAPASVAIVTGTAQSFSYTSGSLDLTTYGLYDVAALQYLYGANTSSTGNKTFSFLPNAPVLQTISDAGPNDTIDATALTGANTIDLTPGSRSSLAITQPLAFPINLANAYNGSGAFSIAYGVNIANALGGSGADTIQGNAIANALSGNAGADKLYGGDELSLTAAQKTVYRLYGATLAREPDIAGLAGWVSQLAGGAALASITNGFIGSPEFVAAYGALNSAQFVAQLYNNVLHRAPDPAGLDGWVSLLDGGASRASVVNGFSESAEYQASTEPATRGFSTANLNGAIYGQIYRLYGATLNRAPDAAGFSGWTDILAGGQTLAGITTGFVNSTEFKNAYGALNNTAFVTLLYGNVLKRAPDAAGLNGWVNILNGGSTRESVVIGFSESNEYQAGTVAALRAFIQGTMTAWADTLTGGAGDDSLVGGRGADTFRFDKSAPGSDHVYGFEAWDSLNLTGFGYAAAAAATAKMAQVGVDTIFADQGETITFHNTALAVVAGAGLTFA